MVVVELLHLPLLGLLLQRLVHLSARSKLKNEVDPEQEKLMLTCFMCTLYNVHFNFQEFHTFNPTDLVSS